MARVLEMIFNTENGTSKTIRVADAKEPLSGAEVTAVMDSIVAKNIFSGSGGALIGKIDARVITTTTDDIVLV
jgi:hypothetical protein